MKARNILRIILSVLSLMLVLFTVHPELGTSEAKEEGGDWLDDAFVDLHEVMQSTSRRKGNTCCFIISPN